MTEAFLEALRNFKPRERHTPEYRAYYDKETGEVILSHSVQLNVENPEGLYIVIPREQYPARHNAKVQDGKLVYPVRQTRYYNLVLAEEGYGTKQNNPYFIGNEQFYEYERRYE